MFAGAACMDRIVCALSKRNKEGGARQAVIKKEGAVVMPMTKKLKKYNECEILPLPGGREGSVRFWLEHTSFARAPAEHQNSPHSQ